MIYVRLYRWNEQVFTYFAFSIVTFSLCLMLRKVPIELGFALGLFAVFGILRYRTEPIRIRDLTYLFVVIGLAILNAVANRKVSVVELLSINAAIVLSTYILEYRNRGLRREWKSIVYDRIDLVHPARHAELAEDVEKRLGLRVLNVEAGLRNWRLTVGTEFDLDDHKTEVFYRLRRTFDFPIETDHIIGLGYRYAF